MEWIKNEKGWLIQQVEVELLRIEVREFLRDELDAGGFVPQCDGWMSGFDPTFSRKLAAHGWLGMSWSQEYGGRDRSLRERFVVTEELLAAGAPVAAHWIADRQIGPSIMRFGTADQKSQLLPGIASGKTFFCIGMSEPDSGSDLASVKTSAKKVDGGWLINGTKIWTTGAHVAQYMMALVRTDRDASDNHVGLSQFVIDLTAPGVLVRPIRSMDGNAHFNEVIFQDYLVDHTSLLGQVGNGWSQVTSELTLERSGPERFMSTLPLLLTWCNVLGGEQAIENETVRAIGGLVSRAWALRQMSIQLVESLEANESPHIKAAMVKSLGAYYERQVIDVVRRLTGVTPEVGSPIALQRLLAEAILRSPGFSLRGGTIEILRGTVARHLGLR